MWHIGVILTFKDTSIPNDENFHSEKLKLILPSSQIYKLCELPVLCLVAQSCPTIYNSMDCIPPGSSVHGDTTGKNTGVGCHALLQGIFPTQGSNPGLPVARF